MADKNDNLANDYHISANYQHPSILPKVRPSTNSSSNSSNEASRRLQVPAAVPATPRMLRNSSGNFQVHPSPTQSHTREIFTNQTPQRSASDAGYRSGNYSTPPTANANYQYRSPATRNPQSPARGNLVPIDTAQYGASSSSNHNSRNHSPGETPSKLLPPASVNQDQLNDRPPPQRSPTNSKKQQPTQFHRRSIGDWDFMKTIGAGSMGKVKLAKHRKTNEVCAIKIVPRAARLYARAHANDPAPADSNEALARRKEYEKEVARDRRTIREASLGKILYHPYICRLFEVITMSNHFYMLFEYVSGGQMLDYIVSHGSLKERNARKFARGIGSALDYLHRNNVVHRDLKIENIMISKTGDIKIIDFGLSNLFSNDTLLKTYCGSLYFAAPELLSAHPYIGPEVDVWSFGVVLYVLVCGKVPFDDESVGVLHEKIKKGKVEYPDFLSSEVVSLLSRMLVVNPNKRAQLTEVLAHPWMTKGYDLPPSSFVPHRVPLALPLDALVIKEMINLEFGQSEQQVAEDLSLIISSELYTDATKQYYRSKDYSALKLNPTGGFHPLVSIYYLVQEMISRKRAKESIVDIPLPISPTPQQDVIEPEVTEVSPPKETPEVQHETTPKPPPVLTFPEAVHTSPVHTSSPPLATNPQIQVSHASANDELIIPEQQPSKHREEAKGLNSLLRKFSQRRSNSIRRPVDNQPKQYNSVGDNLRVKYHKPETEDDHLVRRVGSMKLVSKTTFEQDDNLPLPTSSTNKTHNRTVSAYSAVKKPDTLQTAIEGPRRFHPTARAKSVGHRRDHASFHPNEISQVPPLPADLNDEAFFDDVTLDEYLTSPNADKVTLVNSNTSSANRRDRFELGELTEDQIVKEAAKATPGTMPSIEYPKTLFLKGLFSVQTTSTKPLPVIRANIISTLSKLGVKFTEVQGGFICVHTPSIEQPFIVVTSEAAGHKEAEQSEKPGSVKSIKSSSETGSTETGRTLEQKITDERSSLGETSLDQQSNPNSKTHRRKFSIGGSILGYGRRKPSSGNGPQIPNTPVATTNMHHLSSPTARNYTGNDFDSSASLDSLNVGQGGSDMLVSSRIEQNKVPAPSATSGEEGNPVSAVSDDYKPTSTKVISTSSRTPLKFEIHIVKVPLVGLFGVHLKKVTGNTWMYKTLAGQILTDLNL